MPDNHSLSLELHHDSPVEFNFFGDVIMSPMIGNSKSKTSSSSSSGISLMVDETWIEKGKSGTETVVWFFVLVVLVISLEWLFVNMDISDVIRSSNSKSWRENVALSSILSWISKGIVMVLICLLMLLCRRCFYSPPVTVQDNANIKQPMTSLSSISSACLCALQGFIALLICQLSPSSWSAAKLIETSDEGRMVCSGSCNASCVYLLLLVLLHVIPLIMFDLMPSLSVRHVLLSLSLAAMVSFPVLTISISRFSSLAIVLSFLQYAMCLGLLYTITMRRHRDRVQCFLYQERLSQYLNENQEVTFYQKELMDMKHLIANVTHDLKTVSSPHSAWFEMLF
jgi:hypothetical protein